MAGGNGNGNGSRIQLWILATHAGVSIATMISATVLGALRVLDAEGVTAIYGAALGLAGSGATTAGLAAARSTTSAGGRREDD